jgi:hypothetical protein
VLFSKVASQVGRFDNPWLILSKYIDAANENCVNNMLPKWENRLGGAQQFMSTPCFTMAESERVDPTIQALLQNSTFVYINKQNVFLPFSLCLTILLLL